MELDERGLPPLRQLLWQRLVSIGTPGVVCSLQASPILVCIFASAAGWKNATDRVLADTWAIACGGRQAWERGAMSLIWTLLSVSDPEEAHRASHEPHLDAAVGLRPGGHGAGG